MDVIAQAKLTINLEVSAIQSMSERINESFERAIAIISGMNGRVVVVGMGKSGIIGRKIVATLASTGTPAFFVHPGEAYHGDLGMIRPTDVLLLISNSGETEEIIRLLPFLQHQNNSVIALTGNVNSTLARHADAVIDVAVEREACSNNLAPTSSTTCTLVMGDAIAVALSVQRNFQPEDFARFHPGGSLGKKLLTQVGDVMQRDNLPLCKPTDSFRDVVHIINHGRLGLAIVLHDNRLVGIVTDGDVRRAFDRDLNYKVVTAADIMTQCPRTIGPDVRFSIAEDEMRAAKINALIVVNGDNLLLGVLQIYAL